jgi:6-phosphogluconolactonase
MKPVSIFLDPESMAREMASSWCTQAQQAKKKQCVFTVVLSGGSTAKALYPMLADPQWGNSIPWESVHIFFADERCVSPDNEESNCKMVYDHLLDHISIPEENIHRIKGEDNPEKESLRYANEIQSHLALRKGNTNFFDWVLLGVGTDGHTASLFPGQNIINSKKLCEVARHPKTGQPRITMTPAAINLSSRITFHCIGKGKSEIVFKLASDPSAINIYPSLRIQGEWFLDKESASKINFL